MIIALNKKTLGMISTFAGEYDTDGIWITDGADMQCLFTPDVCTWQDNACNNGALALKYRLTSGLSLLIWTRECRQPDRQQRVSIDNIILAVENHAATERKAKDGEGRAG